MMTSGKKVTSSVDVRNTSSRGGNLSLAYEWIHNARVLHRIIVGVPACVNDVSLANEIVLHGFTTDFRLSKPVLRGSSSTTCLYRDSSRAHVARNLPANGEFFYQSVVEINLINKKCNWNVLYMNWNVVINFIRSTFHWMCKEKMTLNVFYVKKVLLTKRLPSYDRVIIISFMITSLY